MPQYSIVGITEDDEVSFTIVDKETPFAAGITALALELDMKRVVGIYEGKITHADMSDDELDLLDGVAQSQDSADSASLLRVIVKHVLDKVKRGEVDSTTLAMIDYIETELL